MNTRSKRKLDKMTNFNEIPIHNKKIKQNSYEEDNLQKSNKKVNIPVRPTTRSTSKRNNENQNVCEQISTTDVNSLFDEDSHSNKSQLTNISEIQSAVKNRRNTTFITEKKENIKSIDTIDWLYERDSPYEPSEKQKDKSKSRIKGSNILIIDDDSKTYKIKPSANDKCANNNDLIIELSESDNEHDKIQNIHVEIEQKNDKSNIKSELISNKSLNLETKTNINIKSHIKAQKIKEKVEASMSVKSQKVSNNKVSSTMKREIELISRQFDEAILQLQEYSLPDQIPCRETEKETIKSFIEEGLENNGLSHCLCKNALID